MSCIIKVFLLLAAMICMSEAQMSDSGQCLCQRVRNETNNSQVKDIQIYQATVYCTKVEIVVTDIKGLRFCLNPDNSSVRRLLVKILRNKRNSAGVKTTAVPSKLGSSTATAQV